MDTGYSQFVESQGQKVNKSINLESSKREVVHFYKVSSMKLIADFLSENMEARNYRIFFNKKEKEKLLSQNTIFSKTIFSFRMKKK